MARITATTMTVETQKAQADIERFFKQISSGVASFQKLSDATLSYNRAGQVTGATITRQINDYTKLTQTVVTSGGKIITTNQKIKQSIEGINAVSRQKTLDAVKKRYGNEALGGARETAELQRLYQQLVNMAGKTPGKVGYGDIRKLIVNPQLNFEQNLGTQLGKVQQIVQRIHTLTGGKVNRFNLIAELNNAFSVSNLAKAQSFEQELGKIVALASKNPKGISQAVTQFLNGTRDMSKAAVGDLERLRQILLRLQADYQRGLKLNETKTVANQSLTTLDRIYPQHPAYLRDPQGQNEVNKLKQRIQDLVNRGNISGTRFEEIRTSPITARFGGDEGKLKNLLNELAAAYDKVGAAGKGAAASITGGWKRVVDIFASQVLYRSLTEIINLFRNTSQEAAKFSYQIGLIKTLSQDSSLSISEWNEEIRTLSDRMGADSIDVAAAAYEALSNQIVKGKDATAFMTEAINFARISNTNTMQSVRLLSSALNSFNLSADQSERVARVLFTTIDLGRTSAEQLALDFGRPAVTASQLGVSLEELGAAIAILTQSGIDTSEAFTQITNVFKEIIAPTEKMQKLILGMGYPTGQAAIEAETFAGFMQKLNDKIGGSTQVLSEHVNEIRAFRGVLGLTGPNMDKYLNAVDLMTNSTKNFEEAQKIVNETMGVKFMAEMNKVKNFLIDDLGQTFATAFVLINENILSSVTGMKLVLASLTLLIGGWAAYRTAVIAAVSTEKIISLVTGIEAVKTETGKATLAMRLFGISSKGAAAAMGWIGLAITGITLLGTVIYATYSTMEDQGKKANEAIRAEHQKTLDLFQKQQDLQRVADEKTINDRKQRLLQFVATYRLATTHMADAQSTSLTAITKRLADESTVYDSLLKESITKLENRAKEAESNIEQTQKLLDNRPYEKFIREQEKALSQESVNTGRLDFIREQLQQFAEADFLKGDRAGAEEKLSKIIELYKELERFAPTIKEFYNQGGNGFEFDERLGIYVRERKNLANVEREIGAVEAQNDVLRQQYIERERKAGAEAKARAVEEKRLYEQQQTAIKNLLEFDIFTDSGGLKFETVEKTRAEYQKLRGEVDKILNNVEVSFKDRFDFSAALAAQRTKLEESLRSQGSVVEKSLDVETRKQAIDSLTDKINDAADAQKAALKQLDDNIKASSLALNRDLGAAGEFIVGTRVEYSDLIGANIQEMLGQGKVKELQEKVQKYLNQSHYGIEASILSSGDLQVFSNRLKELEVRQQTIQDLRETQRTIAEMPSALDAVQSSLEQFDKNSAAWTEGLKNGAIEADKTLQLLQQRVEEINTNLQEIRATLPTIDKEGTVIPPAVKTGSRGPAAANSTTINVPVTVLNGQNIDPNDFGRQIIRQAERGLLPRARNE